MATTAEHIRDCPRCYDILERKAGQKLEEMIAQRPRVRTPEGFTGGRTEDRITLMPSKLWPLLTELYRRFVNCEQWPKLDTT